ncbi:hypothetical protein A0H81_02343 [Grifola frondosa]|uniref:Uncharacterized protein n=1 Tax=Grifola frondosa TaxID=5627 RepID=A0A1C7MNT0_GRIFR|nr:hypothetical protein A0H81_02343 [Grifola frondosa]
MRGREGSSSTDIPVHSAISSSALTSRTRTRTSRDSTFEKGGTTSARCTPDRSHVLLNARYSTFCLTKEDCERSICVI